MTELKRIVHVDDDEDIRVISKMAMELVGQYEVEQFSSGKDALAGIEGIDPQLFVLDFMMPGMSGQELWNELKSRPKTRNTPVVFMTAKAEKSLSQTLKDDGAFDVILKPFEPMELCERLEAAWARYQNQEET